jgi:hypothetical protein
MKSIHTNNSNKMKNYFQPLQSQFCRFKTFQVLIYLVFGVSTLKAQMNINGSFSVFGEMGVSGNLQAGADAQLFFQNGSTLNMLGSATTINSGAEIFANTTSTQAGTGRILFGGAAPQTLDGGNDAPIGGAQPSLINVAINNPDNLTLTNTNTRVTSGVDFINGHILLGNNNLELSSTAGASNANETRYVVTNGSGFLAKESFTLVTFFPVGRAISDYTPVGINSSISNSFFVQVKNYSESASQEFVTTDGIDRTWNIYSTLGGGALIRLQHNSSTNGSSFNSSDAFVTQYQGIQWISGAQQNQGVWQTASGTNGNSSTGTVTGSTHRTRTYSTTATSPTDNAAFFSKSSNLLTPLPVRDLSFDAKANGVLKSKLNWTTSSEYNTSHFEVYTSKDGNNWLKIGEVKSVGYADQLSTYQFDHNKAVLGLNFYKINLIDLDGKQTLSEIKVVDFNLTNNYFHVYPNPSSDFISVESSDVSKIELIGIDGKKVEIEINENGNIRQFSVKHLAASTYFLLLTNLIGEVNRIPVIINH